MNEINEAKIEDGIIQVLEGLGLNEWKMDPHLTDTPKRVARAYKEIYRGYREDPKALLERSFEEAKYDQMIYIGPIAAFSTCSHHMLPFSCDVHVGYVPDGKIIGISKFARVVEAVCAKLQVQERITEEIADLIEEVAKPKGVMVVVENGIHLCMRMRGVKNPTATVTTSAVRGIFMEQSAKMEFLSLIAGGRPR